MTDISRPDLIKHLQIDSDTLAEWTKEGLPVKQKGRGRAGNIYVLEEVENWCSKNNKRISKEDFNEARTRKERALASLAELQLAEEEGKLVNVDAITNEFEKQLLNVKTKLLSMPSKIAGVVTGISDINQVKDIIEREVYAALEELSK